MQYEEETVLLLNQMLDAYALYSVIEDGNGNVVDYRFVDVNPAFFEMTGLRAKNVIGRTVRDVLPGIEDHWVERYGQVAKTGKPVRFNAYLAPLRRHFDVSAYRLRPGLVAATFRDITREVSYREAIDRALEDAVVMMGRLGEVRDPGAPHHLKQVAVLSQRIAQALGLAPDKVKGVCLGALLHDIGKIAVPVEILNYPSRLSDQEYALVKTHPQAGFDIAKEAKLPWPIADVILQHHERMDGSGYPHGLKGNQIILEARIIMVADVVETMSCHRPYRESHSKEAAMAELQQNDGRLYDHGVTRACVEIVRTSDDLGF